MPVLTLSELATISLAALRRPCGRKFKCQVQRVHKLLDLDGLGEVTEEAGFQSFLNVARHGIGTEGNDGDVLCGLVLAEDLQGFDGADTRQISIHENDVRK